MDLDNFSSNSLPILAFVGVGAMAYMYADAVDVQFFNPKSMYFPLMAAAAAYGIGTMIMQRGVPGLVTV